MFDNSTGMGGQGSAGSTDIVTALQGIVRQLSALVAAVQGRVTFGTTTLSAAATTVVSTTAVRANSVVSLTPTNAAAATLQSGTKSLYVSAIASGTSFTLATADGTAAAGTETFSYVINTPT